MDPRYTAPELLQHLVVETHCKKCRRELWKGDVGFNSINPESCEFTGGVTCVLTMNQNSLIEGVKAMVKMVKSPTREEMLAMRTVLAVVEQVRPSSTSCPSCATPLVVSRTKVAVHFAKSDDQRPCPASYGTVLAGFLMAEAK